MPKRLQRIVITVAAAVPGVIAAAVAYIYVVGAITAYAQFREADVSIETAMPLVPVEQLLGRGIGELTGTALLLVLGWLGFIFFTPSSPDPPGRTDAQAKKAMRWILGVGAVVAGVFASPADFLPLIATGLVFVGLVIQMRYWRLRYITSVIVIGLVLQGTLAVSEALFTPDPLPTATIQRPNEPDLEAPLVASTGAAWYVVDDEAAPDSDEGNGLRAIPASEVENVQIRQEKRDDPPSLFRVVFP